MTNPNIQNDFSYYRRTLSRKRMASEVRYCIFLHPWGTHVINFILICFLWNFRMRGKTIKPKWPLKWPIGCLYFMLILLLYWNLWVMLHQNLCRRYFLHKYYFFSFLWLAINFLLHLEQKFTNWKYYQYVEYTLHIMPCYGWK